MHFRRRYLHNVTKFLKGMLYVHRETQAPLYNKQKCYLKLTCAKILLESKQHISKNKENQHKTKTRRATRRTIFDDDGKVTN